jgi:hypothetical protein
VNNLKFKKYYMIDVSLRYLSDKKSQEDNNIYPQPCGNSVYYSKKIVCSMHSNILEIPVELALEKLSTGICC